MDKYLIKEADFVPYKDISENIDEDRLKTYILDAQFIEIRGFLGQELYKKIQDDYDEVLGVFTDPLLTALWFGIAYNNVEYYGLKPALVQYSYARLLEHIQLNITRAGVRKFDDEESEEVLQSQIYDKSNAAKSMALAYTSDATTYLDFNSSKYPSWTPSTRKGKTSMNFFKVP